MFIVATSIDVSRIYTFKHADIFLIIYLQAEVARTYAVTSIFLLSIHFHGLCQLQVMSHLVITMCTEKDFCSEDCRDYSSYYSDFKITGRPLRFQCKVRLCINRPIDTYTQVKMQSFTSLSETCGSIQDS